jgi:hypothetical protein
MTDADIVREWLMDEWTAEERETRTPDNNPALAALDRLEKVRSAAEWLIANRRHRGEAQAWKLLADALAKEPT